MRKLLFISCIYILCIYSQFGLCENAFFKDKTAGWFWYRDHDLTKQEMQQNYPSDPLAQIDEDQVQLDHALKIAIKEPTEKNIVNFIKLRNKIIDQSYNFGLRLYQVNLLHPELDKLVTYPSNGIAKAIYQKTKNENIKQKIRSLSKTHGLFYVFASHCPYCHAFASTVKSFSEAFGWSVLPITLDGKTIPEFPQARVDNGMARALNVRQIPSLIMVEPNRKKILPIATGIISEEEIVERINLLTIDNL